MLGGGGTAELRSSIVQAALAVPKVIDTDRVIIEYNGPKAYVDIHIRMDPTTTLEEVHKTSHAVREALESMQQIDHAFVHVEPVQDTSE